VRFPNPFRNSESCIHFSNFSMQDPEFPNLSNYPRDLRVKDPPDQASALQNHFVFIAPESRFSHSNTCLLRNESAIRSAWMLSVNATALGRPRGGTRVCEHYIYQDPRDARCSVVVLACSCAPAPPPPATLPRPRRSASAHRPISHTRHDPRGTTPRPRCTCSR
jgi:hypothetical protein